MKYLLFLFSICLTQTRAQSTLNFDKRFVQCEDRWVAFQVNEDSSHSYGFIYIDEQAGLTLNLEGSFKIASDNKFVPTKMDSTNVKVRLEPNNVKVAIIPNSKFEELQISEIPDWLKYYKTDTASIERLFKWGFLYNSWDESVKALTFLEKAQKINSKYKGLEFELAYAYNSLAQYDKAIPVLESAIEDMPNDCLLYKELSYAQMHFGSLAKASVTCKKGISICSDKELRAEIAYNLAYQYYLKKDKDNFADWASETKKWASKGGEISNAISKLEIKITQ